MSATIYAAPEEFQQPKLDFLNFAKYQKEEEEYLEKLQAYCKENSDSKYAGEIVRIPHADSSANYMVASLRPLELIHIPTGDAWDSPLAELLTAKKVKEMIDGEKKMAKLFGKR